MLKKLQQKKKKKQKKLLNILETQFLQNSIRFFSIPPKILNLNQTT